MLTADESVTAALAPIVRSALIVLKLVTLNGLTFELVTGSPEPLCRVYKVPVPRSLKRPSRLVQDTGFVKPGME